MKPNYIGIVGAIVAFISLALPWWTVSASYGLTYSWYLYDAGFFGAALNSLGKSLWYNWVAILLVALAGILGLVGSVTQNGKKILLGGGLLAVLAIIIFPVGFQLDLSSVSGYTVGIFQFNSYGSSYLSFGFWLALVSAIIMLVAAMKATPKAAPMQPPAPPLPS